MSLGFTLLTITEVLVGLFIIWGFWHEDKMVEFEDRLFARIGIRRKKHTATITRFEASASSKKERGCI